MKEFDYTIADEQGIHARPAGMLVKLMQGFTSDISLTRGEKTINCKKLFALMGLAVKCGETVTFSAEGEDAEAAMTAAQEFMQANL